MKVKYWILILVVLFIAGVTYYYYSNKPKPIAVATDPKNTFDPFDITTNLTSKKS